MGSSFLYLRFYVYYAIIDICDLQKIKKGEPVVIQLANKQMKKTLLVWRLKTPHTPEETARILLKEGFEIEETHFDTIPGKPGDVYTYKGLIFRKENKACRIMVSEESPFSVTSPKPKEISFLPTDCFNRRWIERNLGRSVLSLEEFLYSDCSSSDFLSVEEQKGTQLQQLLTDAVEVGKFRICLLPKKAWVTKADFPTDVLLVEPRDEYQERFENRYMKVSIPCKLLPVIIEKWWTGSTSSPDPRTVEHIYSFHESEFMEFIELLHKALEKVVVN